MPRPAASGTHPDWNGLYQVAASQAGYFTADDANEVGFSLPLLQYHIDSGRIERSQRGVFRLVNFPPTDQEGFVPAWLWSRREGKMAPAHSCLSPATTVCRRRGARRAGLGLQPGSGFRGRRHHSDQAAMYEAPRAART